MTAKTLAQFLDLTVDDARAQWQRILQRSFRPGKRQERFLPVEVLLCYGLFRVLDPHRFGGANIHKVPEAVHRLAHTFKRTPSSLTSKMLNLDGSLKNGGRLEPSLYLRLSDKPDLFGAIYLQILQAARDMGLGKECVPDFMTLFDQHDHFHAIVLLGQEKLGTTELDQVIEESHEYINDRASRWNMSEKETTRLVIHKARQGQDRFARQVLRNYQFACAFCGFKPGEELAGNRLLTASHIKPWKESTNRERLDPQNGVAACPIHDVAFDQGLLTVNGGLRIHRAEALKRRLHQNEQTARLLGEETLHHHLFVPEEGIPPKKRYLQYHKAHIFKDFAA